ncbi:hypothetical protein C8J57DRAFT_1243608 [Mycena rebaudengoi]|nr:hypothetical protein C8J57DRAFT_1243608 [Mycena rebaudengoi]
MLFDNASGGITPLIALATGEATAFLTILGYFISCEIDWRGSRVDSQDSDSTYIEDTVLRRSPIIMYWNVILRIDTYPFTLLCMRLPATALYPLVSCLVNLPISVFNIRASIGADNYLTEGRAVNALSTGRALVYSLLVLIDSSFIRAIRAIHSSTAIRFDTVEQKHNLKKTIHCGLMRLVLPVGSPECNYSQANELAIHEIFKDVPAPEFRTGGWLVPVRRVKKFLRTALDD